MSDTDEQVDIDTEDVQIDATNVYVNNAWSPRAVWWNTVGTVVGGVAGLVALIIVLLDHFGK